MAHANPQNAPKKGCLYRILKWILIALLAFVLFVVGMVACSDTEESDQDSTDGDTTTSEVQGEESQGPDEALLEQAEDAKVRLSLTFGECDWQTNENLQHSVVTYCERDGVMLIVASGPNSVESYIEDYESEVPYGYYVTEDNWVVMTNSQGDANRVWDVMGATGDRVAVHEQ